MRGRYISVLCSVAEQDEVVRKIAVALDGRPISITADDGTLVEYITRSKVNNIAHHARRSDGQKRRRAFEAEVRAW